MLTLLSAVVFGTLFSLFATQNTNTIDLFFGKYVLHGTPIYLVVLLPLVLGLGAAYFIFLVRHLSQSLTVNEQKEKINKLTQELAQVTKEAHKMQLENVRLKKEYGEPLDGNAI